MKTFLFILLQVAFCTLLVAQAKIKAADIPAVVKKSLQEKYPEAIKIKWTREGAGYEADFDFKDSEISVTLDPQGQIIETEQEIEFSALSDAIRVYMQKNFSGKKIKETTTITDSKGTINFEVAVKKIDLIFDKSGALLKKITL